MVVKIRADCSQCKAKFFVLQDCSSRLKRLKEFGEYKKKYDKHSRFCPKCWKEVSTVKCSFCGNRFNVLKDRKNALLENFHKHGLQEKELSAAKHICKSCFKDKELTRCSQCEKPFPKLKNLLAKYRKNKEIRYHLCPYHRDCDRYGEWEKLCPACYQACENSVSQVEAGLARWVKGTKEEFIHDYEIIKELGKIEVEDNPISPKSPLEVEEELKLYAVQLGGNAFIGWFLEQNTEFHPKPTPYSSIRDDRQPCTMEEKHRYSGYATAARVKKSKGCREK